MTRSWRRCVALLLAFVALVATAGESAASVAPDWTADAGLPAAALLAQAGYPSGTGPRRWAWPLRPDPAVVARFDPPEVSWGSGHRGVDLATGAGATVFAPTGGVVSYSGVVVGRGVLVVEAPGGLRTTFEPVEDALPVGAVVTQGEAMARVSTTPGHCRPATCLHWGVLRGSVYLDPLALLGLTRVVLLPLRPP